MNREEFDRYCRDNPEAIKQPTLHEDEENDAQKCINISEDQYLADNYAD